MKNSILFFLFSFLLFGCKSDKKEEISEFCDHRFDLQIISLQYEDGTPVELTKAYVINTFSGEKIESMALAPESAKGYYWITDDNYREQYFEQNVELEFVGLVGDKTVVKEKYIVSGNRCHVFMVKGNKNITITKN